jgi:hypothetical protein
VKIAVEYDGAKHEMPTFGPSDFVAFERKFQKPASVLGEEGTARFEWLTFLVWRGLKKVGVINHKDVPFDDDFLDRIAAIDVGEEKDEDTESPTGDRDQPHG